MLKKKLNNHSKKISAQEEHIQKIYKKYDSSEASEGIANSIAKDIDNEFYGAHFLFELLQNAQDVADDRLIDIQITSYNDYLIFSHNGRVFSCDDVEKICNYAQRKYKDKSADANKIGYKGIGFKTVFTASDTVYTLSGGYSFKFDKNYYNEDDANSKPWQIMPIWVEDEELEFFKEFRNNFNVNIIIKAHDKKIINKEIQILIKKPEIILFLKNIREVTIVNEEDDQFTIKQDYGKDQNLIEYRILDCDNNKTKWLLKSYDEIPVPDEVQAALKKLPKTQCPDRLLTDPKKAALTFAVKIDGGNISALKKSHLFCFLPLKISLALPF
jgi:hypothetical protein